MRHSSHRLKLAILYGPLLHYRIALFNALSDRYELTVFTTSYNGQRNGLRFNVEIIKPQKIGCFAFQIGLRRNIRRHGFDICIVFFDVSFINALQLIVFPVAPETYVWGIWLTENKIANWLRIAAIHRCKASIFYCQQHLDAVVALGVDSAKLYVAPNTIDVSNIKQQRAHNKRNCILFVGSFTKRKGLCRLIRIFASLLPKIENDIRLVLVGDGPEMESLRNLISDLGIIERTMLPGRVNDQMSLAPFYSQALVAVSLSQAGLSVLQSMGFGVPFLTIKNTLSGGETNNIINGVNGYIVEDNDIAIANALLSITIDRDKVDTMGIAALKHYSEYSTIENYAQGFFDAMENTKIANIWGGHGE